MEGISFSVLGSSTKRCATCGETDQKLKRCGKCRQVFYCNAQCQRKDWPTHNRVCVLLLPNDVGAVRLLHPRSSVIVTSTPSNAPQLSEEQKRDAQQLIELDLSSIHYRGEGGESLKALGQQIFDKYKRAADGNSWAGREAAINICEWIYFNCEDGPKRKEYIEFHWDRIGDQTWRWMR